MSCYVYRNARLGVYRTCSVSSSFIDRQLHTPVGQQQFEVAVVSSYHSGSRSLPSIAEHAHTDQDGDRRNGPSGMQKNSLLFRLFPHWYLNLLFVFSKLTTTVTGSDRGLCFRFGESIFQIFEWHGLSESVSVDPFFVHLLIGWLLTQRR